VTIEFAAGELEARALRVGDRLSLAPFTPSTPSAPDIPVSREL
jgi:hypothetical protein